MPYCRQCGTENPEHSRFCGHCGGALEASIPQTPDASPPYGRPPRGPTPYSQPPYAPSVPGLAFTFVLSLFSLLFCCLPLGIVSFVYAILASSRSSQGDLPGALSMQNQARIWAYIAFSIPLLLLLIWAVVAVSGLGSRLN